jgi:hypothetical protein
LDVVFLAVIGHVQIVGGSRVLGCEGIDLLGRWLNASSNTLVANIVLRGTTPDRLSDLLVGKSLFLCLEHHFVAHIRKRDSIDALVSS